jgi:hypothetical protein
MRGQQSGAERFIVSTTLPGAGNRVRQFFVSDDSIQHGNENRERRPNTRACLAAEVMLSTKHVAG